MQEFCERFFKNPYFIRDAGHAFDEKTRARLERENNETFKALLALKKRRIAQRKGVELGADGDDGVDKDGTHSIGESDDIATRTDYRFTKWSKVRRVRAQKERQKWEEYFHQYTKWKFFASVIRLRIILSHKEWDNTCHLHERTIIRKKIRLENILRIRLKYNIDEIIPNDSIVFDKIMRNEEEKKRKLKLRQERMLNIIKKIAREMNNGIRFMRRPEGVRLKRITLEEISQECFEEISLEEVHSKKFLTGQIIDKDVPVSEETSEVIKKDHEVEGSKLKEEEDKVDLERIVITKSKSTVEQEFPEDVCFFAIPSTVTFDDFELNKLYCRKLLIRNKSVKWAYLRFHKIYTEVWEPGIVEIDIMDAARVKPGLDVTVNVKFSPIHEEIVTADIAFLTLNQDDTKNFHEFRVPVRCTPQSAVPVLEPRELRFPTAQIWKYSDLKYSQRVLTISNEGKKSFSIVIEERNERDHYFVWQFNQANIQCKESSVWSTSENNGETNVDNNGEHNSSLQDRKFYQIEVPPKFKCNLIISFRPRYTGLHHEVLEIRFLRDNKMFGEQSVPIWAEVVGYQIHLDPPCIDLGIIMIDSGVSQQIFNIVNTGRCHTEVLLKSPKCLENQVCIYPKSTIVQVEVPTKITVRLIPETNITRVAKRYYDSVSNMLEFPIHVQIVSQESIKPPPLVVKVLATLTTCNGLVLEPASIDLGFVYTHESVYKELTLTNESLLSQEYAFINLPPTMEIQPNYGFGTILPGETIKLHLICSPCITDIPGNDVRANGLTGERSFLVQAVTLAELAGSKKQAIVNKLKNSMETLSTVPRSRGFPPPLPINLKVPTSAYRQTSQETDNVDDRTESDSVIDEKDEHLDKEDALEVAERITRLDTRKDKSKIEVYVYIIDAFCELSEQIIKFPATPCGSFSMASIHLRGFNAASYPNCTCGMIRNQNKEFTGRFEFQSSSNRVKIMPQSGVLSNNEIVEVNFLFKPRLPRKMVFEEGLRLRMNVEEQATKSSREEKSPGKEGKKKKKKERTKKESAKKQEFTEIDKLAGELSLLETFEPCVSTIFISCAIDLVMKNGSKHEEILFAKLICPITGPEILLLNQEQEIAFGPTAIGISSKKFLSVKNISKQSVKVDVSLLDPFGPFFVPPGKTIETGSILKLPITYRPIEGHEQGDEEYFEVSSKRSRTRWTVKVSGRGVVPSYVLRPQFRVARFKIVDEKPIELKMSIQNRGECPLLFRVDLVDTLEGEISPEGNDFPQETIKKERRKRGKDASGRRSTREEFDDNLRPNEELAIFGGNLRRSDDHGGFSFWNLDEKMQLLVPNEKKMDFSIRFNIKEQTVDDSKETTGTVARKKKAKKGSKMDEPKKTNYSYVAVLKLMLGTSTLNEFVMICSTK